MDLNSGRTHRTPAQQTVDWDMILSMVVQCQHDQCLLKLFTCDTPVLAGAVGALTIQTSDIEVILFGTEHSGTHIQKYKNVELILRYGSEHFRETVSTNIGNSKHRIKHSYWNKQHHHCHHTQRHKSK